MSGNSAVMDVTAPPILPTDGEISALLDGFGNGPAYSMNQKPSTSLTSTVTSDDEALVEEDESSSGEESGPTSHRAYAKLQFSDAAYYMDTIAIVIGRDMVNYRLANWDRLNLSRHLVFRYPPLEHDSGNSGHINGLDIGGLDIGEQDNAPVVPTLSADVMNDIISTFVNTDNIQRAASVSMQGGTHEAPAEPITTSKADVPMPEAISENEAQDSLVNQEKPAESSDGNLIEGVTENLQSNGDSSQTLNQSVKKEESDESRVDSSTDSDATAQNRQRNSSISSDEDLDLQIRKVLSKVKDNIGTEECPLVSIHPPKKELNCPVPSGGNIARRHARISYNHEIGNFEIEVLGKNGLFLNGRFLRVGLAETIDHGDAVQIADILFRFVLPNRESPVDMEEDAFLEDAEVDSELGHHYFGNDDFDDEYDFERETEESSNDFAMAHINKRTLPIEYFATNEEDESSTAENESSLGDDEDDEDDEDEEMEDGSTEVKSHKLSRSSKQDLKKKGKLNGKAGKLKLSFSKSKSSKDILKKGFKSSRQPKSPTTPILQKGKSKANRIDDANDFMDHLDSMSPDSDRKDRSPDDSRPRIARDGPLTNGEDIEYAGLPAGVQIPARRKGPGRPPKDGIMSKRERQQILREHNQKQKALEMGLDPSTVVIPEVKKPARPRKNSNGEEVQDDGETIRDGNDPERKKIARPARSPSPEMKREDYTEEQLKRPPGNYVQFIHEAISNAKDKALNLQQIYSAMERKYPYFKFEAPTQGWQSSVRHNLNQHEAFRKIERDGKGWLWGIDPAVSIEKDKKKRPTPPPPHTYHAPNQGYAPPYYHGQNGVIPPGGVPQRLPPRPPGATNVMVPPANRPPTFGTMYAPGVANRAPGPHNQTFTQNQQRGSTPLQRPMSTNMPTSANRPTGSGHITQAPIKRPSQDVIDTFVGVFMKSFLTSNKGSDSDAARQIVDNAIKRVLEPHTMVNVPLREQESAVINAFKMCIDHSRGITSQGPQGTGTNAGGAAPTSSSSGGPLFTSTPGVQPFSRSTSFVGASRTPTPNGISSANARTSTPTPLSSGSAAPAPVRAAIGATSATSTSSASGYGDVRLQTNLPRAGQDRGPIVDAVVTALGQAAPQHGSHVMTPNSPLAPAVEPLTPPAGASGIKRSIEEDPEDVDGKKARIT